MRFQPGFSHKAASSGDRNIEHVASFVTTDTGSSYTVTDQNLGEPHASRAIIIALHVLGSAGQAVTSVHIGGVSAQKLFDRGYYNALVGLAYNMGIWGAFVPSGLTGDVVVSCPPTRSSFACDLFRTTGLSNPIVVKTSSNPAASLNTEPGDILVAIGMAIATSFPVNGPTWTGLTGTPQKQIRQSHRVGSGYALETMTQSPRTVSASFTPAGDSILVRI